MGSMYWLSWRFRSEREFQVWEMEMLGPESIFFGCSAMHVTPSSKASRASDQQNKAF